MNTPPELTPENLRIASLGPRKHRFPLAAGASEPRENVRAQRARFVADEARVRYCVDLPEGRAPAAGDDPLFEKAGPREFLFFQPDEVRAAIVTCGGLCPGLNNVIRSVFLALYHNYGVRTVYGVRYGFEGLNPAVAAPLVVMTPDFVEHIQESGGSVLGSSRGPQAAGVMVDFLVGKQINMLFCVGGDGTQRGAHAICEEIKRRGLPIAVVGIPKTIDNDILYIERTFGLATAIEKTNEILNCAHNEAHGIINGVGLVKVMGRDAGFIAAGATLANQEVNFTLVPEIPFALDGERGFLNTLRQRLERRAHAVVIVAEGAGQELLCAGAGTNGGNGASGARETDASGNIRYGDIGVFLKDRINAHFKNIGMPVNVKYFDPSYFIRSVPANCSDSWLCDQLARHAVHAAMAGKTDMLVGYWNTSFTHIPIALATAGKKRLHPDDDMWKSVLAATGQPREMR